MLFQVLNSTAAPLPQVPAESTFETLAGAAAGRPVTGERIKAKLSSAEATM
ncbi:hypothetical protein AB0M46_07495 [Dactylosporangium sp. NPDC051485]|uniref:hypothetical protein n=1 Tax=Dactylosporangium sp. NPDC051485 TaxID=3154846 RepID=UPI0034124528